MKAQANNGSIAQQASRMSLGAVQKGPVEQPIRAVLYGPPGVGKSTFAASAPQPIFLGAEKGTAQLDVVRFPQPHAWVEVSEAIKELLTQEHDFRTLVIDTLDWIEPLCHRHIAKSQGKEDIDDIGYGRGYNMAVDQWRLLLSRLEMLVDRKGMNIILLAHSHIRSFKNPEGDDFDRYELKIHHKAAGVIQEWADEVLFANYETFTHESKGRVRGIDSGARIIHTTRHAAFDAKNRSSLPESIPLSWEDYAAAAKAKAPAPPDKIKAGIETLLEGVEDESLTKRVRAAVERANDSSRKLSHIYDHLKASINDAAPTKGEKGQ